MNIFETLIRKINENYNQITLSPEQKERLEKRNRQFQDFIEMTPEQRKAYVNSLKPGDGNWKPSGSISTGGKIIFPFEPPPLKPIDDDITFNPVSILSKYGYSNPGAIIINDELFKDCVNALLEKEFNKPLPLPWNETYLLDIVEMISGEFDLLVPDASKQYNTKQLAQALKQIFETYSEASLYKNIPLFTNLDYLEIIIKWLLEQQMITNRAYSISDNNYEGLFGSPKKIVKSFKKIEQLG